MLGLLKIVKIIVHSVPPSVVVPHLNLDLFRNPGFHFIRVLRREAVDVHRAFVSEMFDGRQLGFLLLRICHIYLNDFLFLVKNAVSHLFCEVR